MDPSRSNRVLDEWDAVARSAQRPAAPPRGIVMRSGLPGGMLVAAGLAVALVLAVVLLGRGSDGPVGGVVVAVRRARRRSPSRLRSDRDSGSDRDANRR